MSSLVEHARRELALIGEDEETTEGLIRVIQAFADMGHSGGSASICIPRISKLLSFENLTPLTDDPEEWAEVHDDLWQSKRNPEAFSRDGGKTFSLLSTKSTVYISKEKS